MDTKQCKHCKEQIAKNAKRCPKCGGKLGMPGWIKFLIVLGIIFFCIVGCVASCTKGVSDAVNETTDSFKDKNGKTTFKLNESFENKYEKITMIEIDSNVTGYNEYISPKDGNKIIAVKFEVENINAENDELYVSNLEFNAFADDVAVDEYIYLSDKYNTLTATVGKGKKTAGYVLYEVPINATKITIDYNANFWVDGNAIEFIVQE
jgi:hypothetical protein